MEKKKIKDKKLKGHLFPSGRYYFNWPLKNNLKTGFQLVRELLVILSAHDNKGLGCNISQNNSNAIINASKIIMFKIALESFD